MKWINALGLGKTTAKTAKDRLQIIIAQQRTESNTPDYLPLMREEIMKVIAKYTKIDSNQVKMDLHYNDNNSVMELNVILPEQQAEQTITE